MATAKTGKFFIISQSGGYGKPEVDTYSSKEELLEVLQERADDEGLTEGEEFQDIVIIEGGVERTATVERTQTVVSLD